MGKHKLFEICSDIYRKRHWARDFTKSIIILIQKARIAMDTTMFMDKKKC